MSDFATSFGHLRVTVSKACHPHREWPARVSAGIHAAVDFAVANPAAAHTLTAARHAAGGEDSHHHRGMIEHFASMLGRGAPHHRRLGASTDRALIGGIAAMVAGHVRAGREDRLGELAPEIVYLTLLPYLGFAEAKRWAEPAGTPGRR
jgi:hypothetical protein